ncbi:ABC transporter permease subunit [Rathayibacter festucae]|uniref:ABC transporter permease subunit n=2 Tax=Rathayibacter TaxID=33886 RepID=A0ABX6H5G3_9MICO|nr:ABC transporter permease subunit [Rathayibacter festucae]
MLVLMLVPVLLVIGYSFFDNVITNPKPAFVGLANYLEVLGDPKFRTATGNTIVFVGVSVAAHLVLGLGFAMLLNSPLVPTVAKSLFRVVYVLPWLFTVAIIAVLWRLLLNPNGVINYALISLGLTDKGIEWLASPATALLSVTFINIWAGYSFYMITLLAGLQGIPHDLYEAAKVDGASAWQRFWNVTIPQLKPIIISMSVLDIIWTSQQFALIWMTTGGGPIDATEMLSTYTYKLAFSRYEFSVASASAVLILLLTMVLAFFYVRNQKARD